MFAFFGEEVFDLGFGVFGDGDHEGLRGWWLFKKVVVRFLMGLRKGDVEVVFGELFEFGVFVGGGVDATRECSDVEDAVEVVAADADVVHEVEGGECGDLFSCCVVDFSLCGIERSFDVEANK